MPSQDVDKYGLLKHFESTKIHIAGLIVCDYSHDHSHHESHLSLSEWLQSMGVPALYGIDTRERECACVFFSRHWIYMAL